MATLARPNADTVVEQTVQGIRDGIRSGRFAPGQRLVVSDITKMFGVSAGPVREAISRLTGEGLIDVIVNRGAVVRSFSAAEVLEIFQVREVIEGLAARLAAEACGRSKQNADRVRHSIEEMHEVLTARPTGFLEHNQQFHEMLYELAGNRRALEIAEALTLPIYRLRYHHLLDREYAGHAASEHDEIAEAILAGDGDRAERAMRKHIRHSGETMTAAVENRGH